jgi:hypothetical protein
MYLLQTVPHASEHQVMVGTQSEIDTLFPIVDFVPFWHVRSEYREPVSGSPAGFRLNAYTVFA